MKERTARITGIIPLTQRHYYCSHDDEKEVEVLDPQLDWAQKHVSGVIQSRDGRRL